MPKAKRVTGSREAPNLPKINPENFDPKMWEYVKKGGWTLEEASYCVNNKTPDASIDINNTDNISKTYVWLFSQVNEGKLVPTMTEPELIFTQGNIMRHLWENWKPISLKIWAMYDFADKGEVDGTFQMGYSKNNYIKAAKIIWKKYPNTTKREIVDFLVKFPDEIKKENGLPLFFNISRSYLEKNLQSYSKVKAGRPKKGSVISLDEHKDELITLIKEKMGH